MKGKGEEKVSSDHDTLLLESDKTKNVLLIQLKKMIHNLLNIEVSYKGINVCNSYNQWCM